MKNNNGFTLVEILVSITLLMMVGVTFFQFFIFSQKATTYNKEKLVAINLSQSVLEQIKNSRDAYPEITEEDVHNSASYPKRYDLETVCPSGNAKCIEKYEKTINHVTYQIIIEVGKELDESNGLPIHPVEVKVYYPQGNEPSSVKGLIKL